MAGKTFILGINKPSVFVGAAGLTAFTSKAALGAVVPIPTLAEAVAPFTPLILPKTKLLEVVAEALAPIAVALVKLVPVWVLKPKPVLLLPVVFQYIEPVPEAVF